MTISLIAAITENNVIGAGGGMPWCLPNDLKHFKKITVGSPIIMGRKTFESLGKKPLPGRTNVILSKDISLSIPGAQTAHTIEEAMDIANKNLKNSEDEIFIIGGQSIFATSLPMATKLYLTRVHSSPIGDTYFPQVDFNQWNLISSESHKQDDTHTADYTFEIYAKNDCP